MNLFSVVARSKGLGRQIVSSVAILVLAVMMMVLLGSYAFYATLWVLYPAALSAPDSWLPSPAEWGWIAATTLTGLGIAVWVAIRLARRILAPLNSVATSLRQVAQGDLAARAATDDHSLGEATQLVNDFNAMAERLERGEQERIFWNAAIAHELRTPVTILRGRLQGLTEGIFQPDPALFASLLLHVEGLGRLIEDLRVVGLAESGHLQMQLQQADLQQEVMTVVKACESALQEKGFALSLALQTRQALCDPVRIRQALLALLENALQHATPGTLTIRTWTDAGQHGLSVEDSGPGIDLADAHNIFDAFQRGPLAPGAQQKGSGLGLAVVRAIAGAHRGTARYARTPSGGACFALRWPV
ncbi:HAMP domain-containing protein [Herbaspirillum sp. LeCh32-8]|uniref:ATP-binding protein n=1 Tax=Herbaspirillum sp. LeCh32-8 TaxID=2821356 RepID=UPI001AE5846E|nr:ATP-binding protein [Herbaspirillum sp. LeCh32-8]MBP0598218.1 HAMP domain-containing protein [Herbaspirillum sp. LeCh32-8]